MQREREPRTILLYCRCLSRVTQRESRVPSTRRQEAQPRRTIVAFLINWSFLGSDAAGCASHPPMRRRPCPPFRTCPRTGRRPMHRRVIHVLSLPLDLPPHIARADSLHSTIPPCIPPLASTRSSPTTETSVHTSLRIPRGAVSRGEDAQAGRGAAAISARM